MSACEASEDINPNTDPDLLLQVRNQELYTTPDRMFCSPLDSPAAEEQCQGNSFPWIRPFSVLIVKGFSSQELNIFLHFNSTSLTEAGGVKEAAGLALLWGKGAQSLAMLWFGA